MTTVITHGVNEKVRTGKISGTDLYRSIKKFHENNWGNQDENDIETNKAMTERLDRGEEGMVLGTYLDNTLWIIRNAEAITVLLPSEY